VLLRCFSFSQNQAQALAICLAALVYVALAAKTASVIRAVSVNVTVKAASAVHNSYLQLLGEDIPLCGISFYVFI